MLDVRSVVGIVFVVVIVSCTPVVFFIALDCAVAAAAAAAATLHSVRICAGALCAITVAVSPCCSFLLSTSVLVIAGARSL